MHRKLGVESTCAAYVQIVQYLLYAENTADAYTYITKAAQLVDLIKDVKTMLLYKYCYAQVHDANLKFNQAASLYFDLSQKVGEGVPPEELNAFLTSAVTCTLLAPAGTQRSRLLTVLYKDNRTALLEHFNLLEKMYAIGLA
jgi:COP9 signalosome complex subunit 4